MSEQQEHTQHETEIADTINDECFLACIGSRFFQEIEADQQVAAEAHTLPPDEKEDIVGSKHQNQHEEHE